MINKEFLKEELDRYSNTGIILKPVKYNRDTIYNLFKKYKQYGMTENSYCCYGECQCCWQDPFAEGIWGHTLKQVKEIMLNDFKYIKQDIRSVKKNQHRMYMYKDKNKCFIYIYGRDLFSADYHMWFSNVEK